MEHTNKEHPGQQWRRRTNCSMRFRKRRRKVSRHWLLQVMLLATVQLVARADDLEVIFGSNPSGEVVGEPDGPNIPPAPTETPSFVPSANPTTSVMPSDVPSVSPQPTVTLAPSAEPSLSPTHRPTEQPNGFTPVARPTPSPPTESPTNSPVTPPPTRQPTLPPTAAPSDVPSDVPSEIPSDSPSESPSQGPSPEPTTPFPTPLTWAPTMTHGPTGLPSLVPTTFPSLVPSEGESTLTPTESPTGEPTLAPSLGLTVSEHDLDMRLSTVAGELRGRAAIDFQRATRAHIAQTIRRQPNVSDTEFKVEVTIAKQSFVVATDIGSLNLRRGRKLQTEEADETWLEITVFALVSYRSDTEYDTTAWINEAFNSPDDRAAYITRLQQLNSDAFEDVESVGLTVDGIVPLEKLPPTNESGGLPLGVIVGAAAGGVILLVLAMLAATFGMRRRNAGPGKQQPTTAPTNSTALHVATEIVVGQGREDDISTLGDPVVTGATMMTSGASLLSKGERTASAADDYDYAREYLLGQQQESGEGSLTLESAGGEHSGRTSGSFTRSGPLGSSVFSDDASFEQQYNDAGATTKEQRLEIDVPAGKLGMVIDTPNGGVPVVHAIKAESVLANRVLVGDRLVAVDDDDVTSMTAVQVSKLISIKSNKKRILVFLRTVHEDNRRTRLDSL